MSNFHDSKSPQRKQLRVWAAQSKESNTPTIYIY
jgi:hypothetical protein